jgi:hypothetical protein
MKNTKNFFLHVEDPTTLFLSELYKDDKGATVVKNGLSKQSVLQHIENHDRSIFTGHGTSRGLLNVGGAFSNTNGYIIDEEAVDLLKKKNNSLFIWCYASDFQKKHNLYGVSSWMFISQDDELWAGNLPMTAAKYIDESNTSFVSILKECMHLGNQGIYEHLKKEYGKVALGNPVAKFNCEHLYFSN